MEQNVQFDPISPNSEGRLEQILRALAQHYTYRGINLRTECENFDWHNIGVINESQVRLKKIFTENTKYNVFKRLIREENPCVQRKVNVPLSDAFVM